MKKFTMSCIYNGQPAIPLTIISSDLMEAIKKFKSNYKYPKKVTGITVLSVVEVN